MKFKIGQKVKIKKEAIEFFKGNEVYYIYIRNFKLFESELIPYIQQLELF